MITLILVKKNTEEEPFVLDLPEEDWEFSVRLGTAGYNDNLLSISNVNKHLGDSQDIINLFNILRDYPKENIDYVMLKVNGLEMFNSNNLNFYYNNIFIQYVYTMSQATITKGNYGLTLFLGFSVLNPETQEINDIILSSNENNIEEES